jgi:hypothetical protein
LFAEKIGFRFFRESRFEDAGARAADPAGVGKCQSFGLARGVLFDCEKSGCAAAFREDFADAVAGRFRSDHRDVDRCRWLDGAEADVETMREHERLAGLEVGRDGLVVKFLLFGVRNEDHDDVGPSCGFGGSFDTETVFFGFGAGSAGFWQTDRDVAAAIAQIERVGVALRAITENRDLFGLNEREVGVLVVVKLCHVVPFVGRSARK